MTAFHHYELLCDHPGCAATLNLGEAKAGDTRRRAAQLGWVHRVLPPGPGRRMAGAIDLCPEHAGEPTPVPLAGDPLPAVCADEAPIAVDALREVRDVLEERARWFSSRGRPVPAATAHAIEEVAAAILYAAGASGAIGEGRLVARLCRAALVLAAAAAKDDDEECAEAQVVIDAAALAYARSLTPADRERLGR